MDEFQPSLRDWSCQERIPSTPACWAILSRPGEPGLIPMHGVALFVFSKCCPNQAVEKTNLGKSDLETVRAPRCIDKPDRGIASQ
jgi:hypothetical protein